ncbi:uncharacterized protein K444DRAFT_694198 [Hyaloscypha bicolor E]|uniref:Uncharacterized protein n=1 Tax=Hyaloscypha bicolor E TaxID=1095630 RepID=A0A2J6T0R0_9HELO|nr:uncharacterized protein K444DRAFT_694198 [Hyaloscypha bicolor E]PMD56579.1 hypothetical protein K444DRAFT_694198 [Hyaloscypha bicolor E]
MQLTLLTPIILHLASVHALPTPVQATSSSNSTDSSTNNTGHYPHAAQNHVVAIVDLCGKGGCQPKVCNHNFLINLNGYSAVTEGCSTSVKITTGSGNSYSGIFGLDFLDWQKKPLQAAVNGFKDATHVLEWSWPSYFWDTFQKRPPPLDLKEFPLWQAQIRSFMLSMVISEGLYAFPTTYLSSLPP